MSCIYIARSRWAGACNSQLATPILSLTFSFVNERQFRSSDAVTSISFLWLFIALPRESHSREIRDLAIPVRGSNQLSYEATDVGSWSFVSSNEPVKNGCEVIYEMFHMLNCSLLFPHWDIKTKRPEAVKLDLPLFWCPSAGIIMSLPSSMADFVPRDR